MKNLRFKLKLAKFSLILFLFTVLSCSDSNNIPDKKNPRIRIDYIGTDGNVRYSRYSNHVHLGSGYIEYIDFSDGYPVYTTETVKLVSLNN